MADFDNSYEQDASDISEDGYRQFRKYDKNYQEERIYRRGYKKPNVRRCFGSALYGPIRNAVDGTYYNMNVGDRDEEQLFKVILADGKFGRKDPLMLYYDSPDQYERHRQTTVSQETKEKWHQRHLKFI
jgi:hypothetical protein